MHISSAITDQSRCLHQCRLSNAFRNLCVGNVEGRRPAPIRDPREGIQAECQRNSIPPSESPHRPSQLVKRSPSPVPPSQVVNCLTQQPCLYFLSSRIQGRKSRRASTRSHTAEIIVSAEKWMLTNLCQGDLGRLLLIRFFVPCIIIIAQPRSKHSRIPSWRPCSSINYHPCDERVCTGRYTQRHSSSCIFLSGEVVPQRIAYRSIGCQYPGESQTGDCLTRGLKVGIISR